MRILMLTHRIPYPPRTGDKVRAYHVARHLAGSHRLTLAFLGDEPGFEETLTALQQEIPDVEYAAISRTPRRLTALASLAAGRSATMVYFDSRELRRRLAGRLRDDSFDLCYVHSSSMVQYLDGVDHLPLVMDFVDVDSDKWLQFASHLPFHKAWVYRLEGARLRSHEVTAARRANRCLLVTRREESLLHSFAGWAPTTVIPNGVDIEYFAPRSEAASKPVMVFTGAMDYLPNVDAATWFAERILPGVRARVEDARFVIAGKDPAPAVKRLATIEGVEVTGTVSDIRPFLAEATVAVAPLRIARGVQNKILEAMAMGLPVVATSRAHDGLDARPGRELFVEDDPERFARRVAELFGAPATRAEVGSAARRFVETHHSWAASMRKLDQVLADVTRSSVGVATGEVPAVGGRP